MKTDLGGGPHLPLMDTGEVFLLYFGCCTEVLLLAVGLGKEGGTDHLILIPAFAVLWAVHPVSKFL